MPFSLCSKLKSNKYPSEQLQNFLISCPFYVALVHIYISLFPVNDSDGDEVRCRWATEYYECGDVCDSLPEATINEASLLMFKRGGRRGRGK